MSKRKVIFSLLQRLQNRLKERMPISNQDQNVLHQSRFLIRTMTWGLIGTTGIGIMWLLIARTEEIVIVQGKLEPIGEVKEIQIPVGGVVQKILVKGGDYVQKDQVLIELDNETAKQNLKSLKDQLIQTEQQLELKSVEKNHTYDLTKEEVNTTKANLLLQRKILQKIEILVSNGAISELQYLEQVNKVRELQGKVLTNEMDGNRQQSILDQQVEELNSKVSQLQAKATEAQKTLQYKSLKAPVNGIIFDLKPTSAGFVAQSSEPVMKIVPLNKLEADVEIPSNKIGFVRIGMEADISIDSFPASDFGVLEGKLQSIGSDALPPDASEQRQEYRYPATIKLLNQQLKLKDGRSLNLQTGMSLTANIKLRRVSYLQLIISNLRSKVNSLKSI